MRRANKFVIFSQSRSGSTLLKDLVGSHPSIHCEGETLELSDGYISNRYLLKICRRIPVPYFYFRKIHSQKEIYGFTLFIYHTPYIKHSVHNLNRLGWKIIYLKRKDIINQAISNILAKRSRYFHNWTEETGPESVDFEIKSEEFLSEIKTRVHWHQKEGIILKYIDYLPVFYENGLEHMNFWQPTADKVFKFLNLETVPVKTGLKKTYAKPYSELISNYQNLIDLLNENDLIKSIKACHTIE